MKLDSPLVAWIGQGPVHGDEVADVLIERVVEPALVHQLLGLCGHVGRQYYRSAHVARPGSLQVPWRGQHSTTWTVKKLRLSDVARGFRRIGQLVDRDW